ncbi:MAG: glycosyltransferase family 2 protein [Terracidiphilus sp.]
MNPQTVSSASVPGISVVLCTYNGGRYLGEQLESIAEQTRLPAELVACDDCSTDNTVCILQEFSARAPFLVRIFRNTKRLGSTRNFDQGIRLAQEEFISLCDQDDRWVPNKLEKLSDILIRNPLLGGVFSDAVLIDGDSKPIGINLFEKHKFSAAKQRAFVANPSTILLKHDVVTGSTLMFKAAMRRYFSGIPLSWVHDGWLTWIIALHSHLDLTSEPLTAYRIHAGQQIGIGPSHAARRTLLQAETRRQHYGRVAQQFHDLLLHLMSADKKEYGLLADEIRRKICFLQKQSMLSHRRAIRFLQMFRMLPDYARYTRGLGSFRNDLLLD